MVGSLDWKRVNYLPKFHFYLHLQAKFVINNNLKINGCTIMNYILKRSEIIGI